MSDSIQYNLGSEQIPKAWYNVQADLPVPMAPPLHPGTKQPLGPEDLAPLFPMELIKQEVSQERRSRFPVRCAIYMRSGDRRRCSRAAAGEGAGYAGKDLLQIRRGVAGGGRTSQTRRWRRCFTTRSKGSSGWQPKPAPVNGAARWRWPVRSLDMECTVFMVKVSYEQKPYRKGLMEAFGGRVIASPSTETDIGAKILGDDPNCSGSLGIAISEAVEVAAKNEDTKYALGSVLTHVLLHQTVIGLETLKQLEYAGDYPDIGDRLHRRRLELCRLCLSVYRTQPARRGEG